MDAEALLDEGSFLNDQAGLKNMGTVSSFFNYFTTHTVTNEIYVFYAPPSPQRHACTTLVMSVPFVKRY